MPRNDPRAGPEPGPAPRRSPERSAPVLPLVLGSILPLLPQAGPRAPADEAQSRYAAWELGPPSDPAFFPLGVWLQDPRLAPRYRELGVNLFVGLWQGPTEEQLRLLAQAGMRAACAQNEVGLAHLEDPTIVAWMQLDEPDNRERRPDGTSGPKATPEAVRAHYERLRRSDPRRPVWLNLGQGVANDEWRGLGIERARYPEYASGGDILSFDVYPVANLGRDDGGAFLHYVAKGVRRLRTWSRDERVVWNFVECTAIRRPDHKPTPAQVRAEVWLALVAGSRGIVWFCHVMEPEVVPAALLADREMAAAVGAINREVLALAPVLNAPTLEDAVQVTTGGDGERPAVAALVKRRGSELFVLAVGLFDRPAQARFSLAEALRAGVAARVVVQGEERELELRDGAFADEFAPHAVHVYRLEASD